MMTAVAFLLVAIVILGGTWLVIANLRRPPRPFAAARDPVLLEDLIPESRFVEVEGARLHYIQAGQGADMVLLHGIGASVFIWRLVFPLLEMKYRVTAFDLAGFGKSSKEAKRDYGLDAQSGLMSRALTEIGIERAHLVGSSMGGVVALWMAKREPTRFSRVAALAPATDRGLVPAGLERLTSTASLAAPVLRRALNRQTMRLILGRVLARRTLITDAVVDSYLEPFLDRGDSLRAFWSALSLLRDSRLPHGLKDVTANVLVIYGARDLMVPRSVIDGLLKILPQAKVLTHPDGGHHVMEDEPEWTAEILDGFFSELAAQP